MVADVKEICKTVAKMLLNPKQKSLSSTIITITEVQSTRASIGNMKFVFFRQMAVSL